MESLGRYLTTVAAAAIICSVLEKFSGKGGGKPQMVQGSLKGCAKEILEMMYQII